MRLVPGFALSLVPAVLLACGGGDAGGDDTPGPPDVDAAPGEDPDAAPSEGAPDAAPSEGDPDAAPPAVTCGTAQPDVSSITGTEGLAIGPDGTIYFSQSGGPSRDPAAIGRLRPGQTVEPTWAILVNPGGTVWGLALTDTHLYAGYRQGNSIWRVDLATGRGEEWLTNAGQPNGVIIGADGGLYYSDFATGHVHRVDLATKMKTTVTTSRILTANGLYSVDATHLLVLAYNDADVIELTLANGVETSRRVVADLDGTGTARIRLDGITRDGQGRWYLTDNRNGAVIRRPSSFAAPSGGEETLRIDRLTNPANLLFGRGALSCDDLYVTAVGDMRRITID